MCRNVYRRVCRHEMAFRHAPLESSGRGCRFEYRHVHARAPDLAFGDAEMDLAVGDAEMAVGDAEMAVGDAEMG